MASNLSTQGSMTVKEYDEYFLKHEVCKTMSEKILISMYLACLNETVRNSLKGTKFSTLEKLMECARLAEHPIEQRCMTVEEYKQFFDNHECSSTVDEYVDFFIKHDVDKKHDATTLMSMFRHGLKEEIRDELGNMEFSSLEELIESALEAGELFKEGIYDSDWCMDESEHHSVKEDLTDDTLSSGEFRETGYRDEDPDERPENDSQTSSDND
ncbi:hypothetical protein HID58_059437 [Brassica napus]|uniref:Uncharacterized protein n=1 Tax=Brassica napus TaxID=3708 RepID=A0ABQ7ZTN8_BRANA|nr:hypothetical protein HID58_059437 [Brassica napus]